MMRGYDRRGVLTLVDGIRQGNDTGHIDGIFLDPRLVNALKSCVTLQPCCTVIAH